MKTPRQKRQQSIAIIMRSLTNSREQLRIVSREVTEIKVLHKLYPELFDYRIKMVLDNIEFEVKCFKETMEPFVDLGKKLNEITKLVNDAHRAKEKGLKKVSKNISPHPLDSSLD